MERVHRGQRALVQRQGGRAGTNRRAETRLTVRSGTAADAADIARVHVRSWQVAYRGMLPDALLDGFSVEQRTIRWADRLGHGDDLPGRQLLVAGRGHAIEGFATFGPSRDADGHDLGELYAIYVDPAAWSHGIGRMLMQRAVDGLRAAGFAGATLWVLEANARVRGFYEHAGWRTDGAQRTEEFGEDWFAATVVRYRRDL